MKLYKITCVLAVLCAMAVSGNIALAQTDYSYRSATTFMTVGASFSGGGSMAVDDPNQGFKIGPVFAYKFGIVGMYPISSSSSVTLDLGLDKRGNKVRAESDANYYTVTNVQYFSITPGIRLSSFWFGINMGLPMSGVYDTKDGTVEKSTDFTTDQKSKLGFMIEPRLGVTVPVVDQQTWWLGLNFNVGYSLSKIYNDNTNSGGSRTSFNGSFASAHLGFTVQYAIPHTGRK